MFGFAYFGSTLFAGFLGLFGLTPPVILDRAIAQNDATVAIRPTLDATVSLDTSD